MADNRLEYTISAIDRSRMGVESFVRTMEKASGSVTKFNANAQAMKANSTTAWQSVQRAAEKAGHQYQSFEKVAYKSVINTEKALMGVVRASDRVMAGAAGIARSFARISVGAALTGTAAGLTAVAAALTAVGKRGVDMNVTLMGSQAALSVMAGSSQRAAGLIADLRKEALSSLLTFKDMLPIAQSLVAVLGPGKLGAVIPIMRAFGDTASMLQVPQANLGYAMQQFNQLMGRPFAQQEEINSLAENLPGLNPAGILREKFGTNVTDELKSKGISGQQVGFAIVEGMQRKFGGAQARMGGSIPMLSSGIGDTMNDLSAAATKGLTASVTKALQDVLAILNRQAAGGGFLKVMTLAFNEIGGAIERLTAKLPEVEKFFLSISSPKVWGEMKEVGVGAIKVVGGAMVGLGNIFKEFFENQIRGTTANKALADSLKKFAIVGILTISKLVATFGMLEMAIGGVLIGIGAMTKNAAMLAAGTQRLLTGGALAAGAGIGGALAAISIAGLRTDKIASGLEPFRNQKGFMGAYSRGYLGFGDLVDNLTGGTRGGATAPAGTIPTGGASRPLGLPPAALPTYAPRQMMRQPDPDSPTQAGSYYAWAKMQFDREQAKERALMPKLPMGLQGMGGGHAVDEFGRPITPWAGGTAGSPLWQALQRQQAAQQAKPGVPLGLRGMGMMPGAAATDPFAMIRLPNGQVTTPAAQMGLSITVNAVKPTHDQIMQAVSEELSRKGIR